jgi:hypothetical protein
MKKSESLYHFLPRKGESEQEGLLILRSILKNGLLLNEETIHVGWKDEWKADGALDIPIHLKQYRFCLTAISEGNELIEHCKTFGSIGLEFNRNKIERLGGFPVFYIPGPDGKKIDFDKSDFIGVSLLYRLAEVQQILEDPVVKTRIGQYPQYDYWNILGSIRLLGNITYPTTRLESGKDNYPDYYGQREWRLIKGMLGPTAQPDLTEPGLEPPYFVTHIDKEHVSRLIEKVVVHGDSVTEPPDLVKGIKGIFDEHQLNVPVVII